MPEPTRFDPEIKKQFKQIIETLFAWIWWMIINVLLGIVFDLGFFDDPYIPMWKHILFFIWFIGSLSGMVWLSFKIWGKKIS